MAIGEGIGDNLGDGNMRFPVFDERTGGVIEIDVWTHDVDGQRFVSRTSLLFAIGAVEPLEEGMSPTDIGFPCELAIWTSRERVTISTRDIPEPLTLREFSILSAVASRRGDVADREEIQREVWGNNIGDKHVVDVHLNHVRAKLGASIGYGDTELGPNNGLIETVRSRGFRMGERAFDSTPLVFPGQ